MTWNRITCRGGLHPYRKKNGSRIYPNRHSSTWRVPLGGEPIHGRPEQQAGLGMTPQHSSLLGRMQQRGRTAAQQDGRCIQLLCSRKAAGRRCLLAVHCL